MASIDDEILMDEEELRREMTFIREQLPLDLKEKYSDEQLSWMLGTIADYYVDSGMLDSGSEEVEIDLDKVSVHVCQMAEKEGRGKLDAQDVFFIVEADLDFMEQEQGE